MSALLSVSAIAAQRGCDRTTAWRWLTAAERTHGAKLVRQKRTIYIDAAEYMRVVALDQSAVRGAIAALERRFAAIEERMGLFERRLDVALRQHGSVVTPYRSGARSRA